MLVKVPGWVQCIFSNRLWRIATPEKIVYLTFDDGPVPEVTPWVLEQLNIYNARATFFCIGDNIRKHPDIFRLIRAQGHTVGNHTYNHLNGWKTSGEEYLRNTVLAEKLIFPEKEQQPPQHEAMFFRPPYGRMTGKQARLLREYGYQIVMWEVLSRDYDSKATPEKIYQNILKNTRSGSIIVFHDSLKAERNLRDVLPRVLKYYSKQGFSFRSLNN